MSPGDSSLRTGSFWLAFVTGENALDSQKCFKTYHIVGWVMIKKCFITSYIVGWVIKHCLAYRMRTSDIFTEYNSYTTHVLACCVQFVDWLQSPVTFFFL